MTTTTTYTLNDCHMASLEAMARQSLLWYGKPEGVACLAHMQQFIDELAIRCGSSIDAPQAVTPSLGQIDLL